MGLPIMSLKRIRRMGYRAALAYAYTLLSDVRDFDGIV